MFFLMHALNDFVSHMMFPVVGVAAHVYKHWPVTPPSPFTQKPQKDWAASQDITGNTEGSFSDVDSPEYKHYILFLSWRVAFGKRFGWTDTNTHPPTHTNPHMADHDCYSTGKQAGDGQRETRLRVGRASSLQCKFPYFFTKYHRCFGSAFFVEVI